MLELKGQLVTLVGYGESNRAMCRFLMERGIYPVVRNPVAVEVPRGIEGVFGDGYLDGCGGIVFRSPGVRPDKIGGNTYTEAGYALEECRGVKIGVSGSDGKTTTSTLIYLMLMQGGKNAYLGGNIGTPLISFSDKVGKDGYLVAELSSFQLMDMEPCLDVACITNITENHLDWHLDMAEYVSAKGRILKNARRRVLNYDDEAVFSLGGERDTYFSLRDIRSKGFKEFACVAEGHIYYCEKRLFPVKDICLKGEFNIKNVLCAVACAYPYVGAEPCGRVARSFCGVDNRMEPMGEINGVSFVNSAIDSTPSRTIKTLSAFEPKRTVAILGGYDKSLSYECLGGILGELKGVVLCGENRDKILPFAKNAKCVNTLGEAVFLAFKLASKGDTVVLSPASASFDMFKNYKEKAQRFKQEIKNLRNFTDRNGLNDGKN